MSRIASAQYGQKGSVRAQVVERQLVEIVQAVGQSGYLRWSYFSGVGSRALHALSYFFSFRRAAIVLRDENGWKVVATHPQSPHMMPLRLKVDICPVSGEPPTDEVAEELAKDVWSDDVPIHGCMWLTTANNVWYLFSNKEHANGRVRESFNRLCFSFLKQLCETYQQELESELSLFRQMENLRGIIHTLAAPVTQLGSALAEFDADVYHDNRRLMQVLLTSPDLSYMETALAKLYEAVDCSRRRTEFEISKFLCGIGIDKYLDKPRSKVPIGDDGHPLRDGDSAVNTVPVGLCSRVRWSFSMYESTLRLRAKTLDIRPVPSKLRRCLVMVYEDALKIVVDNLVDNAVKYAYDESSIWVSFDQFVDDTGVLFCRMQIGNYGNGVTDVHGERIFEPFRRGRTSSTSRQKVEGTGLGLYIVKTVVENYGGGVSFSSTHGGPENIVPGEGFQTVVSIWLPLHATLDGR